MDKFLQWTKEKGVITDVVVKETSYAGYGLFAPTDLTISTVVHIPKDLLLTSHNVLKDTTFANTIYDYFSKKHDGEDGETLAKHRKHEKLVLRLFILYCSFVETEYQPYIDILPTLDFFKANHVLFQLDCIEGTSLETSSRAKRASLQREWKELKSLLPSHTWIADIDFERYVWADCVFWSRVVGIGKESQDMALIPFFDFANHSHAASNMRWQLNDGGLDLVTFEPVERDTELLLSYGSKPNQELLFLHGFCIQNNPEPSCVVVSALPFLDPQNDPINGMKQVWLKQQGAQPTLKLIKSHKKEAVDVFSCGWTRESIVLMYFVVLDEDNGVRFLKDKLFMGNQEIISLDALEKVVGEMDLLPVIQLRAVLLLIDVLEYHFSMITQYECHDTTPVAKQAAIYREEETDTLELALQSMNELRDLLMTDPVVLSYLENVE